MKGFKEMGLQPVKNHGSVFSQRGRPDIEVDVPFPLLPYAVPFKIEVKRASSEPEKEQQQARLREARKRGAAAFVATRWETVESMIERTRKDIVAFYEGKRSKADDHS
jgi:hypothetical protein